MPLDLGLISSLRPQTHLFYFPSIDSTMSEAARMVRNGACDGAVVVAEEQTAGLGRLGRNWVSQADVGVYCSVLLRIPVPPAQFPIVSLMLGLATADAIEKVASVACDLRWPNDVLISERKVAGILPHLVEQCIVAGIGINVNNTKFDEGLRTQPTSLHMARGGKPVSREHLLVQLLTSIDEFRDRLVSIGPRAILEAFSRASSYVSNRRVVIEDNGTRGITAGLDENGFLLVRSDGGKVSRVAAGGVRPAS